MGERMRIKYKFTTHPDGSFEIENLGTAYPGNCGGYSNYDSSGQHVIWYDMGDGSHIKDYDLEKLTNPYGE